MHWSQFICWYQKTRIDLADGESSSCRFLASFKMNSAQCPSMALASHWEKPGERGTDRM